MSNNRSILKISIISTAVIILSLLYYLYRPTTTSWHPKCPVHYFTGLNCPGCGSQRAMSALLHGEIIHALHNNALAVFALPLLIYSAFVYVWNAFSKKQLQQSIFYSPNVSMSILIIVIAFTILRNIPIKPFIFLAPL